MNADAVLPDSLQKIATVYGEHASTLVRLARRAFHEYQRQLWDSEISFDALDRSGSGKGAWQ